MKYIIPVSLTSEFLVEANSEAEAVNIAETKIRNNPAINQLSSLFNVGINRDNIENLDETKNLDQMEEDIPSVDVSIARLSDFIRGSKKIVFLTGAGVSTHSGIPDYRSVDGLYNKEPEYLLNRACWDEEYEKHIDFIRNRINIVNSEPNDIHYWISSLDDDHEVTVITQNIDGLHQKAGSKNVIEYHGNIKNWKCVRCGKKHDLSETLNVTYCSCGGKLNSNVVLYGDSIKQENIHAGMEAVDNADLIIVVGTSLKVYPFSLLIQENPFCEKILINKEPVESNGFDLELIDDALYIVNELEKFHEQ